MSPPEYGHDSSAQELTRLGSGAAGILLSGLQRIMKVNWYRPLTLVLLVVIAVILLQDTKTDDLEIRDAHGVVRLRAGIFETEKGQHPGIRLYAADGRTVIADLSGREFRSELKLQQKGGQQVTLQSTYETSSLIIQDQKGNERLTAGMTPGAARIQIANSSRRPAVVLAEYAQVGAGLIIGDQKGKTRAGIVVGDTGPMVLLRDEEERPRFTLDLSPQDSTPRVTEFDIRGDGRNFLPADPIQVSRSQPSANK